MTSKAHNQSSVAPGSDTYLLSMFVLFLVVLDDVTASEEFVISVMAVPQGVIRRQVQDSQL